MIIKRKGGWRPRNPLTREQLEKLWEGRTPPGPLLTAKDTPKFVQFKAEA